VVAHDPVGRQHRRQPAISQRGEGKPSSQALLVDVADLELAVCGPDMGVEDGDDPVAARG
jgi:hypothetical protein